VAPISKSQRGGEDSNRGMDYQKRFAALLCCKMLLEGKIKRVTCEHLDDIEVEEETKIIYYQLKSTKCNSLRKKDIIKSFKLFSDIDSYNKGDTKEKEYVLVSNARIDTASELEVKVSFNELSEAIKKEIKLINGLKDYTLEKIYVMKGPALEDIYNSIVAALVKASKDVDSFSYKFEDIANSVLFHINKMCSGLTDLFDDRFKNFDEKEQFKLNRKSMYQKTLSEIINNNRIGIQPKALIRVSKETKLNYKIRGTSLNLEIRNKIHQKIREYRKFDKVDPKQIIYLQKFEEMSKKYILYEDEKFLMFLKNEIKRSSEKNLILCCLYILDRLITMSKIEGSKDFLKYVYDTYFRILKMGLEKRAIKYEYSFFKIQQIFEQLKDIIPTDQLCDMYWNRMVEIIKNMKSTGLTDNSLWNCIDSINQNQCVVRSNWRSWLLKEDAYSPIKDEVIKELKNF
jgi:hypothetical protein